MIKEINNLPNVKEIESKDSQSTDRLAVFQAVALIQTSVGAMFGPLIPARESLKWTMLLRMTKPNKTLMAVGLRLAGLAYNA